MYIDLRGEADVKEESKSRTIAFRTDMDGLPMEDKSGEGASENGWAHSCGHDGHMAIMLGFVSLIRSRLDKIPSNITVRILCQPGEEGADGALEMIKDGCLEGVDEIFGLHNSPLGSECTVMTQPGPVLAGVEQVEILVRGRGGHGSEPALSIDPITAAAAIHAGLNTIKSRKTLNKEMYSFVICAIEGGDAFNAIPDTCQMKGNL